MAVPRGYEELPQSVGFLAREREFARVLRDMRVVLRILNVRPSSDGLYHITVPRGTAVALSGIPAASTSHDAHIGMIEGFSLFEPVDPLRVPSRQY